MRKKRSILFHSLFYSFSYYRIILVLRDAIILFELRTPGLIEFLLTVAVFFGVLHPIYIALHATNGLMAAIREGSL